MGQKYSRTGDGCPEPTGAEPPAGLARVAVIYQKQIGNREAEAFDARRNGDGRSGHLNSLEKPLAVV